MPWTSSRFAPSMSHLPRPAREKAIANALLDGGVEEDKAIRIAMAKAKEWVRRHGL